MPRPPPRYSGKHVLNMLTDGPWKALGSQEELFTRGEGVILPEGQEEPPDPTDSDSDSDSSVHSGKLFALFI